MKKYIIIICILALAIVGWFLSRPEKPVIQSQTREVMLGADTGARSPGTLADDATVGTVAWADPIHASVSDDVYAVASSTDFCTNIKDKYVNIVKADASLGSENKALGTTWPSTDTYSSYGSNSDLWSETWTPANINDTDFGVVVSAYDTLRTTATHYLKASNFGFSIPVGSTIIGIKVEIEKVWINTGCPI